MAPDLKKIRQQLEDAAAKRERDRLHGAFTDQLIATVSQHLGSIFAPVLEEMRKNAELNLNDLKEVIKQNLKGANPGIDTRELSAAIEAAFRKLPPATVNVKAPDVTVMPPSVNVSAPGLPEAFKAMLDYTNNKPLPVMMFDQKGKPFQFSMGAAGGRGDFFTIVDIKGSTASLIDQVEGALRVTGTLSVVGSASSTLAILANSDGAYYNSDNPLPVSFSSSTLKVDQVSGGNFSVYVTGASGTVAAQLVNDLGALIDPRDRNWSISEKIIVDQLSGASFSANVLGSVAASLVDSSGVQYSGSNPLTVSISGSLTSTVAVGDIPADGADTGSAPLKVGGIARTTNPTAVADGDRVSFTADDKGRQVMRAHQVRGLLATAYVSVSTGTEATLLAGAAGVFNDLVQIIAANQSSAAVQLDIRAVNAGNVVMTLYIPANSTAGAVLSIPWPQSDTGNAWTVDLPDITGTTVNVSALFTKEV